MPRSIRRIALNTGGGDAPGLNAVIRAAVLSAIHQGWEVYGIRKGYESLLQGEPLVRLDREAVRGITHLGGTILGTTNRGNPFEWPEPQPDGTVRLRDRSGEILSAFREHELDALIAIGGDGSLHIANRLAEQGLPVVGVPKTIDNDIVETTNCFGFDTAVAFATDAIDRLHTTAEAHHRVMVVEVMGRYAGWIALYAGVAGGADVVLIPEIPFEMEKVADRILTREQFGARFSIVVVAEGAKPVGGKVSLVREASGEYVERLGGIGALVAADIEKRTGKETRNVVLGHLQRGGAPTSFDRTLATRFGARAVELIEDGQFGYMVAFHPPDIVPVSLEKIVGRTRNVPPDFDVIRTARAMGISLGD